MTDTPDKKYYPFPCRDWNKILRPEHLDMNFYELEQQLNKETMDIKMKEE